MKQIPFKKKKKKKMFYMIFNQLKTKKLFSIWSEAWRVEDEALICS